MVSASDTLIIRMSSSAVGSGLAIGAPLFQAVIVSRAAARTSSCMAGRRPPESLSSHRLFSGVNGGRSQRSSPVNWKSKSNSVGMLAEGRAPARFRRKTSTSLSAVSVIVLLDVGSQYNILTTIGRQRSCEEGSGGGHSGPAGDGLVRLGE